MNKKEKYAALAQKTLRECLKLEEFSSNSITNQIGEIVTEYKEEKIGSDFKMFLHRWCPFFAEINKKEDIPEVLEEIEKIFLKEYKKFETNELKPTQIMSILCVLEALWDDSKLEEDVKGKMEKFSKKAYIIAKLYLWFLDEKELWEICRDFNSVF